MKYRRWDLLAVLFVAGCEQVDLERMIDQPSYRAYEESSWFDDRMAMRLPPEGAISREQVVGPPELVDGYTDAGWVQSIPFDIDRSFITRGRDQFRIFCAACHGLRGDGESQVAENMMLVRPPSLHSSKIRAYPAGRLYGVILNGFGLMPSYAAPLDVSDRWAVVAYVQALQLSQSAVLAELPESTRREAERWLR